MSAAVAMPHWDLSFLFPSIDSPELAQACEGVYGDLQNLKETFDRLHIEAGQRGGADAFDEAIAALNEYLIRQRKVGAYLHGLITTNSKDEAAQAKLSEFESRTTELSKLSTRLTAWIGSQDVDTLLKESEVAREHEWMVRKAKIAAEHLMSPAEEALYSDLALTGSSAWQKLHGNMTSQLQVQVGEERIAMSMLRNRAYDPDREVRREAYMAELDAWKAVEVPMAACLNSVKGEVSAVAKKRRWSSPLEAAVFNANIDRQTLDAMMQAARESFPDFRRYLQAKARMLGLEKLAFFDVFAPVGEERQSWAYDEAERFVADSFRTYSDRMADYAQSMYDQKRMDVEPRAGKRGAHAGIAMLAHPPQPVKA